MSQFTGGRRVRCVDCLHLQGNKCLGRKDKPKVKPKKKRNCGVYEFKGEYQNSTPLESTYVPHVDAKTKKLMKKLMKLGVVPVSEDEMREVGMKKIAVPASTATAQHLGTEITEDGVFAVDPEEGIDKKEEPLIWTPDSDKDE